MTIDLYYLPLSPPCRAVMLTIEALGIDVNYKTLNILNGEHLTQEYEEMNPQRTIPFMVDDDVKLSESRAIMGYLVDQYGSDSNLYPTELNARALVNQFLQFDAGKLYSSMSAYYYPRVFQGQDLDESKLPPLKDGFDVLNKILENKDFVTGENLTIADLTLIATTSTAEVLGFDFEEYPNVSSWIERVKSAIPGFEAVNGDVVKFKEFFNKPEEEPGEEPEEE
ncbi:glutathione S-transferase 1-1-like [Chelonus insularis]|uniref:glutathione S-transferase 1-1-like n=1 Tax=Chelonus insularis TaxID=460826 RepID=UPI00158A12A9|nr:glutathione S-transferase 1-1-like [Chelonus insularis]